MSFDLYFAGTQNHICETYMLENNFCRLQSQLNDRKTIQRWCETESHGKLFIDSGAYTAYTRDTELDVNEYIGYLNSIDKHLTIFAQIDKIPGKHGQEKTLEEIKEAPILSWENYLYMREKVVSPDKLLPIFHRRESWEHLERMLETTFDGKHIPYIGIAATTDSSTVEKEEWFHKVFNVIRKSSNPNVKTHAFGMTSLRLLETFPFTSADSTAWIMVGANGAIMSPFGVIYVSNKDTSSSNHVLHMNLDTLKEFYKYLDSMEISFDAICEDYKERMLANLKYLKKWSDNYVYKGSTFHKNKLF